MKSIEDNFKDWENYVFGYGYGTGEEHILPELKGFLSECPLDAPYDYQKIEAAIGPVVCWFLINILCHANIIEYGSSPRFGWLTDQGKALKLFVSTKTSNELIEITSLDNDYIHCGPDYCNCGDWKDNRKCENPFWK